MELRRPKVLSNVTPPCLTVPRGCRATELFFAFLGPCSGLPRSIASRGNRRIRQHIRHRPRFREGNIAGLLNGHLYSDPRDYPQRPGACSVMLEHEGQRFHFPPPLDTGHCLPLPVAQCTAIVIFSSFRPWQS